MRPVAALLAALGLLAVPAGGLAARPDRCAAQPVEAEDVEPEVEAEIPEAPAAPRAPADPRAECDAAVGALARRLTGARAGRPVWEGEAALIERLARPDCAVTPLAESAQAPPPAPAPSRIEARQPALAQPTGPGPGPWILLGAAVVMAGGVAWFDVAANDTRDRLADAQAQGDRRAFRRARGDFEDQQLWARGLAAGAGVAAVGALVWALVGGDPDPVQSRPVFGGTTAGFGGSF